tara:strand:- start:44 stop:1063 length:1020 start_codon:yes stop_codon:yes gene_type:complete
MVVSVVILMIAFMSVGLFLFNSEIITKNVQGDGYSFEYSASFDKSYSFNYSINKTFVINNTTEDNGVMVQEESIVEENEEERIRTRNRRERDTRDTEDEEEINEEDTNPDEEIIINLNETQNETEPEETENLENESIFSDDFSSYSITSCVPDSESIGPWDVVFSGYGCVDIAQDNSKDWLSVVPMESTESSETHATLVVGPEFSTSSSEMTFEITLKTIEQLRDVDPNPWEVGWVLWHYTDNAHFYYVILKPNGWELGKRDPAYPGGQRFLATGSSPQFSILEEYDIKIVQDETNTIQFFAENELLTTFTDEEDPYNIGKVGMYTEDALVYFTDVMVN